MSPKSLFVSLVGDVFCVFDLLRLDRSGEPSKRPLIY